MNIRISKGNSEVEIVWRYPQFFAERLLNQRLSKTRKLKMKKIYFAGKGIITQIIEEGSVHTNKKYRLAAANCLIQCRISLIEEMDGITKVAKQDLMVYDKLYDFRYFM